MSTVSLSTGQGSYTFTAEDGTVWSYDEALGDYVQHHDDQVTRCKLPLSVPSHTPDLKSGISPAMVMLLRLLVSCGEYNGLCFTPSI